MVSGDGNIKVDGFKLVQFEKKHFDNYSDAEVWLENTKVENDGEIRKEAGGGYYIFVKEE